MTDLRTELLNHAILRREGGFTLASGRSSDYLVNVKNICFRAPGAGFLATALAQALEDRTFDWIAGVEMGGVPLVALVATARAEPGFVVRKEMKGHGSMALFDGLPEGTNGGTAILLEDVTTSGGSVLRAITKLRDAGFQVTDVVTVIERQEGAKEALAEAGINLKAIYTASDLGLGSGV